MSIETKYYTEALSIGRVVVDATAGGRTLVDLGIVLNPKARRISLQAVDGDVYVSDVDGLATTSSFVMLNKGSITLDITMLMVPRIKFLSGGSVNVNVLQLGD